MAEPKYATLDGNAVRMTDHEAIWCVDGVWTGLDSAEANHNARLLSKEKFEGMFPQLPSLPKASFQSAESR
jgi:hypothetical protein